MQKCAEMSAESTKTTRSSAKKPRFGRVANPNIGRRTGIDVIAGKTIRKGPDGLERFSDYWTDSELDDTGKVQPIATSSPHKKAITGNRVKTTQILVGELVDNLKKSSNVESAKSPSPKTAEARSRLEENANRTPQKSATQSRFSFSGNASAANAQTPKKKSILFAALEELALSRNVSMGATAPKIPDEKDDDLGDFSDSSSSDGIVLLSGKPDDKINGATDATSPRRSPRRSDKINGATDATSLRRSPRRSDKINGATDATSLRRSPRRSDTPKNLAAQLANAFKESQAIQNNEPEPSTSKGLPVAKSKVFRSKVPVPIKPGQRSIRKSNKTVEEQEENGPKIVDVVSLTSRNSASPRHPTTVTENEVAQQSPLRNLSFDVDVKSPEKAADPHFRTTEDVPDEEESRVLRSSPENNVASGKQQSPMKETPVKSRKRALDTAAASDDVESLKKPATSKSTKKKSTKPASKKRQPKSQQSSQKTTGKIIRVKITTSLMEHKKRLLYMYNWSRQVNQRLQCLQLPERSVQKELVPGIDRSNADDNALPIVTLPLPQERSPSTCSDISYGESEEYSASEANECPYFLDLESDSTEMSLNVQQPYVRIVTTKECQRQMGMLQRSRTDEQKSPEPSANPASTVRSNDLDQENSSFSEPPTTKRKRNLLQRTVVEESGSAKPGLNSVPETTQRHNDRMNPFVKIVTTKACEQRMKLLLQRFRGTNPKRSISKPVKTQRARKGEVPGMVQKSAKQLDSILDAKMQPCVVLEDILSNSSCRKDVDEMTGSTRSSSQRSGSTVEKTWTQNVAIPVSERLPVVLLENIFSRVPVSSTLIKKSKKRASVVKTGPRRPLPKGKVVSPKKVGSTATKKLIANSAPPEPTPGVRRSQRNRFRRLDFRYNERIVYEHTASGEVRAIGIESESLPERKLRQEHSPEDVSMENISSTTVLSPQGNHEISKRVLHTKNSLEWRGPSGAVAKKKDPYSITKFNDSTAYSQGFLKIMPLEEKPLQMNSTHEMMFTVFQGKVKVQVNRTVFRLGKGDSFEIPKGNIYSIKNMQNGEANLVFSMVRSSLLDDTF